MSAEPLNVNTQQLKKGAAGLEDAAEQLNQIKSVLQASLSAEGDSWGSDSPGQTHGLGYTPQAQENIDAVEDRFQGVADYATTIAAAAVDLAHTEQNNTGTF